MLQKDEPTKNVLDSYLVYVSREPVVEALHVLLLLLPGQFGHRGQLREVVQAAHR